MLFKERISNVHSQKEKTRRRMIRAGLVVALGYEGGD
jgi:hypothetical protein